MRVSVATPESALEVWAQLQPQIDRALSSGVGDQMTSDLLLAQVVEGRAKLWVAHEGPEVIAGLVIGVRRYPKTTKVVIELAAGRDLDAWIERIEQLLFDFRDLVGADSIECACRAGLARRLKRRGWHRKSEILELT